MKSSREQFEKYVRSKGMDDDWYFFTNIHPNHYDDENINDMWLAWQASREAIVIELPFRYGCPVGLYDGSSQGVWDEAVDCCADAISANGIIFTHDEYKG